MAILQVGDVVKLKHGYYGDDSTATAGDWLFNYDYNSTTNSLFRVSDLRHSVDGLVDVILLEHQNDIWDITQVQEKVNLSEDNVNLPQPPSNNPPAPPTPGTSTTVETSIVSQGGQTYVKFKISNIDPLVSHIQLNFGGIGQENEYTWTYNNRYDPWYVYMNTNNASVVRYKVNFQKGTSVYPIVSTWQTVTIPTTLPASQSATLIGG